MCLTQGAYIRVPFARSDVTAQKKWGLVPLQNFDSLLVYLLQKVPEGQMTPGWLMLLPVLVLGGGAFRVELKLHPDNVDLPFCSVTPKGKESAGTLNVTSFGSSQSMSFPKEYCHSR